jgi:hypothetical protein
LRTELRGGIRQKRCRGGIGAVRLSLPPGLQRFELVERFERLEWAAC